MAMGKVIISEVIPQKPLITNVTTHYNIHHDVTTGSGALRQPEVRYPVLAVTRPSKTMYGQPQMTPRVVKSSKSERLRTAYSKDSDVIEAKSLPDTFTLTRKRVRLQQPSPYVELRSLPKRGHTVPSVANKPATTFERDFWTYWRSVKTGAIHPDDACAENDRTSELSETSSKDLDTSHESTRFRFNSPVSPDPDRLSIKHIFKLLNISDMNVAKKAKNSLERVRLQQKSLRQRGHTLTTVEMALKNARRYRHPERQGQVMPVVPKEQDELGPIVNSPLLKETRQGHMNQPAMPVENAVKHRSFTYVSKKRSRRIREVYVSKNTSPRGKPNVPQSRTMAVFSRQVPEMTDDSLDAALSHTTAKFHDSGRGVTHWVENKRQQTRSQPNMEAEEDSSKVVRLPKVRVDSDDAIIDSVALVNFSNITDKMNVMDITLDDKGFNPGKPDIVAISSEVAPTKVAKKKVNIHLPTTSAD